MTDKERLAYRIRNLQEQVNTNARKQYANPDSDDLKREEISLYARMASHGLRLANMILTDSEG